jgi:hypothetical protein
MATYLEIWAEAHQTSVRIAAAIHRLAENDAVEVERIWQDPTEDQVKAIVELCAESNDANNLFWNGAPLVKLKR